MDSASQNRVSNLTICSLSMLLLLLTVAFCSQLRLQAPSTWEEWKGGLTLKAIKGGGEGLPTQRWLPQPRPLTRFRLQRWDRAVPPQPRQLQ